MKVIGLTGGVGMGKSTCAEMLRARDLPVSDTDVLARQVVEPQQPALAEIQAAFGPEIISPEGQLRRDLLARRVFADPTERKRLEEILHPRIRELWKGQIRVWAAERHPLAFVVIPLLFETRADADVDCTICVGCSSATQQQRLLARGWDLQQIQQRIAAQWPVEQKIAAADYVIWTEGGLELHAAQLDRILSRLVTA